MVCGFGQVCKIGLYNLKWYPGWNDSRAWRLDSSRFIHLVFFNRNYRPGKLELNRNWSCNGYRIAPVGGECRLHSTTSNSPKGLGSANGGLEEKQENEGGSKLIMQCLIKERGILVPTVGALLVSSGVISAFPMVIGDFINTFSATSSTSLSKCALTISAASAASLSKSFLSILANERISMRIRNLVFEALMKKSIEFYDSNSSKKLASALSNDVQVTSGALDHLCQLARTSCTATISLFLAFKLAPPLFFLVTMIPVVASFSILVYLSRKVRRLTTLRMKRLGQVIEHAEQRLHHVRTVKAFNSQAHEQQVLDSKLQQLFKTSIKVAKLHGITSGVAVAAVGGLILSTINVGASLVASGTMTMGNVTSLLMYSALAGASVQGFSGAWIELQKCIGAANNLANLIAQNAREESGTQTLGAHGPLGIVFDNVSFSYPTRNDKVLSNCSFSLEPGAILAILGPSGCGKSTILQLLMGFYSPTSGAILINGHDLSKLDKANLRSRIGWMDQQTALVGDTVRANVAYPPNQVDPKLVPKEDPDKLEEALAVAELGDFVASLPQGADTEIASSGTTLSGGQLQRLGLARILTKSYSLYLLDEATASFDMELEERIVANLKAALAGKTCIIVTHRSSMLKMANYTMVTRALV
ncbi:bifunctional ABC transporter type 1 [Babesia duncani]|uniref:Bifunctional ABC transporter type 1 n=1 Tax=Babesia duncani TaxID=323732 RepID=A0AAD9PNG5_9APIC|nr:bifunctional ABC transporter type 1 [Babesia duncani]